MPHLLLCKMWIIIPLPHKLQQGSREILFKEVHWQVQRAVFKYEMPAQKSGESAGFMQPVCWVLVLRRNKLCALLFSEPLWALNSSSVNVKPYWRLWGWKESTNQAFSDGSWLLFFTEQGIPVCISELQIYLEVSLDQALLEHLTQ